MKEIIILAMGPSRAECPFDCETWGLNYGYWQIARLNGRMDKIFLTHKQVLEKMPDGTVKGVFEWDDYNKMAKVGVEIISTQDIPELNKYTKFPMDRIVKRLGCDYFSNTLSYMIAYAIYKYTTPRLKLKQPLKLRLYGCDFRETGEYALEKGGVEYWIGFARGLGIKVELTDFSTLLRTVTYAPYGFKDFDHTKFADGGRVIIGWDGAVYGKRECQAIGTSCNCDNESQRQTDKMGEHPEGFNIYFKPKVEEVSK